MMEGAQKAADERGVTLTMLGGDNDVTKQVQQVEDFISQGMDAIVIQAVDTTGIVTAVTQANEAGIPVLTTAETPTGGDILCAISFDSYESGFNGGTYIAQTLGEAGKIIEPQGVMGQETSREKSRGFAEAIAEYPEMEILASQPADYDRAEGHVRYGKYLCRHLMISMRSMRPMMKWRWERHRPSKPQGRRGDLCHGK